MLPYVRLFFISTSLTMINCNVVAPSTYILIIIIIIIMLCTVRT